jgi:pyridoxal phosphate-dependent aminotransferase EpsN
LTRPCFTRFAKLTSVSPEAPYGTSTRWLSCLTVDAGAFGASREDIRAALLARDIEARPVWKPMHLQPVFRDARARVNGTSEQLFQDGLCLPSGSQLTDAEIDEIIDVVRAQKRG